MPDPFRPSALSSVNPSTPMDTGQSAAGLGALTGAPGMTNSYQFPLLAAGGAGYQYPQFGAAADPTYAPPVTPVAPAPVVSVDPGAAPAAPAPVAAPIAAAAPAPSPQPGLNGGGLDGGSGGPSADTASASSAAGAPGAAGDTGDNASAAASADTASAESADASAADASDSSDAGADSEGGGDAGGGAEGDGGFAQGGQVGASALRPLSSVTTMPAYADGGPVQALSGPNPIGPDQGEASLRRGEFVVKEPEADRYAAILQQINAGTYDPGAATAGDSMPPITPGAPSAPQPVPTIGPQSNPMPEPDEDDMGGPPDGDTDDQSAAMAPEPSASQGSPLMPADASAGLTPEQMMANLAVLQPDQKELIGAVMADPTFSGAMLSLLGPAYAPVLMSMSVSAAPGVLGAGGPPGGGAPPPAAAAPSPGAPPPGPPGGGAPPGFASGGRFGAPPAAPASMPQPRPGMPSGMAQHPGFGAARPPGRPLSNIRA